MRLLHRATLGTLWPAVICVTLACWVVFAPGCGRSIFDVLGDVLGGNKKAPVADPDPYSVLTVVAWRCTIAAVLMVIVAAGVEASASGLPFPFVGRIVKALRAMAATSVACAVGAWVLKLCLEQLHFYLPWAVVLCALCGLATLGLYVYGHRKVFRKKLGV